MCTGRRSERIRLPDGSGVNREVHAPFCERPAGEIPPAYSPRPLHKDGPSAWKSAARRALPARRAAWPLEDHDLHRRVAPDGHDRALRRRRRHEGRRVPGLCRAGSGPHFVKGRRRHYGQPASHKAAGVRDAIEDAIETAGAQLIFLPPYSPDLNPCMDGFLQVKGIGSGLVNRSVAAMYTASECATGSLRALMNIRLENRSTGDVTLCPYTR
ncbi:hypothetical protein Amn_pc01130 (plasmid) [Aminobacter sp. Y103A]|nr:hypothetical protein Amn_pc01130 [Aminobacter sp. SS-2016]